MAASDPTQLPDGVPEEGVDALYGLPLDEFTPARDALAKELRAAGQREPATWVKALRKPSAAAWLVNQLARTQKSEAKAVLDGSEALRGAQERVLAGKGDRQELGAAAEAHAAAMRALLAKAPGLLDRDGHAPSDATLERAAETLRAIPLDEEARAGFALGRLTRERRASGLGFAIGGEEAATAERPARKSGAPTGGKKAGAGKKAETDATRRAEAAKKAREEARVAVTEAKSRAREQAKQVAELERNLRQAEREAEGAQRRLDKAIRELDRARERKSEIEARLEEAEAAAKRLR